MDKLEIIEQINNVKRNKHKYKNYNDYNNEINLLYSKLSNSISKQNSNQIEKNEKNNIIKPDNPVDLVNTNLTDEEKIEKVENDIIEFASYSYLFETPDVKLLSKKHPLFDLFLIENNLIIQDPNIKYTIQIKPLEKNEFSRKTIKVLLKLNEIVEGKINRILTVLIIFDYIFRNFSFRLSNDKKFITTIKNKLGEFKEFKEHKNVVNKITTKYNLNNDVIDLWLEELNKF